MQKELSSSALKKSDTRSKDRPISDDSRETVLLSYSGFDKYRKSDGTLDYDYFYNNPHESELQLECSVVRHMLAQVKIGMDLSKITLPTFILERRSLLEMYADHFSHPQLFVAIAEGKSCRERMLAALKWYITSFHAGRNYDIAKKPYNPVLGESFICYYDFDGTSSKETVKGGPVPWASTNHLAFYAEQVSHHPPVSAFYAEHVEKKISCNAYIWTKSRFYGLSICVINAGKLVISLLEFNEQYIFTLPTAYARSIMTVPYVELGGNVTASCPQTGFKADIEFITKTFYSNRRNRLICKIYQPQSTSADTVIEGEWTGTLKYKKYSDRITSLDFIDVATIPIHKKIVRPLSGQTRKESRFLWRHVTACLYINNIQLATKYKNQIEQQQRDEQTQRKENNLTIESTHFHQVTFEDDVSWWYRSDLIARLGSKGKPNP